MGLEQYENLTRVLNLIGTEVRDRYKMKLKTPGKFGRNAIATGKLFNSIQYKLIINDKNILLYFVAEKYWINIEDGRSPFPGDLSKLPPINAIKRWIISKKLPRTKNIEYKIQRSILTKGIIARPFLKQITNKLIKDYKDELTAALKLDIENDIKVKLKKINDQVGSGKTIKITIK